MTQAPVPFTYQLHKDELVKDENGKFRHLNEPLGPLEDIPFQVMRTHRNNLPVYTDIRSGSQRQLTVVRKLYGDVEAFKTEVSKVVSNAPIVEK